MGAARTQGLFDLRLIALPVELRPDGAWRGHDLAQGQGGGENLDKERFHLTLHLRKTHTQRPRGCLQVDRCLEDFANATDRKHLIEQLVSGSPKELGDGVLRLSIAECHNLNRVHYAKADTSTPSFSHVVSEANMRIGILSKLQELAETTALSGCSRACECVGADMQIAGRFRNLRAAFTGKSECKNNHLIWQLNYHDSLMT
jgi:hypothetical protein